MNADDPKNEENKELNKCCKEPIFSLYDEFIDSQSFQSCDTKNVARFQDFPDRIDINQNHTVTMNMHPMNMNKFRK